MKECVLIFLIFSLTLSCKKTQKNEDVNNSFIFDSIKPPKVLPKKCSVLVDGYEMKFGVYLSNYFEVTDSFFCDINHDNKIDTLAILTPASLIPIDKANNCNEIIGFENRKLVFFENIDTKKSKIKVFNNVISNQVSIAWNGSERFEKYDNGFLLKKSSGQGCKFNYEIFVNTQSKEIIVDSINLISFCPSGVDYKEKKVIFKNILKIEDFNRKIIDSIKINNDM